LQNGPTPLGAGRAVIFLGMMMPLMCFVFKFLMPDALASYYSVTFQARTGHPEALLFTSPDLLPDEQANESDPIQPMALHATKPNQGRRKRLLARPWSYLIELIAIPSLWMVHRRGRGRLFDDTFAIDEMEPRLE
jgi:hypothetical protein